MPLEDLKDNMKKSQRKGTIHSQNSLLQKQGEGEGTSDYLPLKEMVRKIASGMENAPPVPKFGKFFQISQE